MQVKNYERIRSFVLREGRMTKAQQRAIEQLFPIYGISVTSEAWQFKTIFARNAETILEIGFGMGASLVEMAAAMPGKNFIGIEMHQPGVGAILQSIHTKNLANIRIVRHDAVEVLQRCIPDNTLFRIQIFFPDPWPKRKHHKRRLLQSEFLQLVQRKLKVGGILHIATDWQDYAEHILRVIDMTAGLVNLAGKMQFSSRPEWRPLTKFETRGLKLKHPVWDTMARKVG